MKRIILILVLLVTVCTSTQGQDFTWDEIRSWQVTFYKLESTVGVQVDTFTQGDVIEVFWTQPLTTKPEDEQPDPVKFPNTGEYENISVARQDVARFDSSGALYEADVSLSVGRWAIGVKVIMMEKYDDGSNIKSKQSDWYPIYIGAATNVPPDVPVSIGVRLRQG